MLVFNKYNEADFFAMIDIVKDNQDKGIILENNKKLIFKGKSSMIFHKDKRKIAFIFKK